MVAAPAACSDDEPWNLVVPELPPLDGVLGPMELVSLGCFNTTLATFNDFGACSKQLRHTVNGSSARSTQPVSATTCSSNQQHGGCYDTGALCAGDGRCMEESHAAHSGLEKANRRWQQSQLQQN